MFIATKHQKEKFLFAATARLIVFALSSSLIFSPSFSQAQSILNLPTPGMMISTSSSFMPVLLKGMTINPEDPLKFDFIIDSGNTNFTPDQIKQESQRLVKYFLASMTVPKDDLWVNLSPYEKDRIIPEELGKTELGRDMLAQDYILKQLTASLVYPEKELGKKFWDKVYERAEKEFGTSEIPVNTFNKVWIMPESATVYEHERTVYVVNSRLKVMLDSDYEAMEHQKGEVNGNTAVQDELLEVGEQIIREIIIPEIEKEVNQGKHFAPLRQIYHSLILAKWYKETIKNSLLSQVYVDKNMINGVNVNDETIKDQIYAQYMQAYKKGVFNYIKEDYDRLSKEIIPRKYFSGGINRLTKFDMIRLSRTNNPGSVEDVEGTGYIGSFSFTPQSGNLSSPVLEYVRKWDDLDEYSQDFWMTMNRIFHQREEDRRFVGEVDPPLVIGENFYPSALLNAEQRRTLMGAIDYADVVSTVTDYDQQHNFDVWMTALDAGLGSSVRREKYIKMHVQGRDVLGAKGTDLGFDVNGRFVSVAEIKLLRLIKETKNKKYPGKVFFQPIVSLIDENRTTYDEILQYPYFENPSLTYEEKLKDLGIEMLPRVVPEYPSLDAQSLKPTFERLASGSHGEWGFKFLREALDHSPSKTPEIITFYNGDGTNNAPDHYITQWMLENSIPIVMLSTTKTGIDKKGGQIGVEFLDKEGKNTRIKMLEQASARGNGQADLFAEIGLTKGEVGQQYFNTNIAVINYGLLSRILQILRDVAFKENENGLLDILAPDLIANPKPQNGKEYIQLEGPIGTVLIKVHNYFEQNSLIKDRVNTELSKQGLREIDRILRIVNVGVNAREKFFTPIKAASDFWFQRYTNFYVLNQESWMLENNFLGVVPPQFDLENAVAETQEDGTPIYKDDDTIATYNYYTDVTNMTDAFGENADVVDEKGSLEFLKARGLIKFPNAFLRGKVVIINDARETLTYGDVENYGIKKNSEGKVVLQNVYIRKKENGEIVVLPSSSENGISSPISLTGPWTLKGARAVLDRSGDYKASKLLKAVKIIGDSEKKNETDINRLTAVLMWATLEGHTKIIEALSEKDININVQTDQGFTALFIVADRGYIDIVKVLLDKGADLNSKTNDGATALMAAVGNGHIEIVETLLNKGADVNIKDIHGQAALMLAANYGHTEIVGALLDKGADVNIQASNGFTALDVARAKKHEDIINILEKAADLEDFAKRVLMDHVAQYGDAFGSTDTIEDLIKGGADVNAVRNDGATPLLLAVQEGRVDAIENLIKNGADVNFNGINGTALMLAAEEGHVEVIDVLLRYGADINTTDINGETALMSAAGRGHANIVETLLNKGADVNIKSNDGVTALDAARLGKHSDVEDILLKAGAREGKDISSSPIEINDQQPVISSQELPSKEQRKTSNDLGGIDMNKIDVDRQGFGVDFQFDPVQVQEMIDMGITGFAPVMINLTPVPSILPLLGLAPQKEEEYLEVSSLN